MVCFLTVVAVAAFIAAVLLLVVLLKSDGDLLLMYKAKYGRQAGCLAGKVVWITGASGGIGEHIAYCLAGAECKLVLSARRKEELDKVKQKCLQAGKGKLLEEDILVLPLDLVAVESHKLAVQKVLDTFIKIDILINNAGRGQQAEWVDVDLSVDREIFEVNVFGPVSLTQEVLPHMIQQQQGHIVVVSSVAGKMGPPFFRSYTGAKHALHGYFECLRAEIGHHNIDVTLVCPGPVVSNISLVSLTGRPGKMVNKEFKKNDRRMETDRCAYLITVSIANKLYEAWISKQPSLLFLYLYQYFPDLARWLLKTFGMIVVEKMREHQL